MIQVPYFKQKKSYTCGPASLKMVLKFFGKNLNEDTIARKLKTSKQGTSHREIIDFARQNGFYCYVHENSTIHELRHFINLGLPVIVNYIEPKDNEGHYAVVVGFKKNGLILNDPWNGANFILKEKDFKDRWHDRHKNYRCSGWLLVISKKRFDMGREYNPIR